MDSYRKTDREREMKDKERLTYSYRDTVPVRDTEDIYRETVTERERQTDCNIEMDRQAVMQRDI